MSKEWLEAGLPALLVVCTLDTLILGFLIWHSRLSGWQLAMAAGVTLIIWIITEVQFMEIGFLHIMYFGWGALILLVTLFRNMREHYRLNPQKGT